jgi:hypothetical protein
MLTPDDGSDDDGEKAEGRSTKPDSEKPPAEEIEKHTAAIKKANTIDALKAVYLAIPEAYRATFAKLVNARKAALEKDEVKPVEPKEQAVDGQGGTA